MEINERVLRATDPEVRGLVVVELTDRHTGRTLERVEVENDISEWWQKRARRDARSFFYSGNPSQTPNDRQMDTGLGHVYLSDSDASLGEPLVDGSMTGWADKAAYSGGSTKKGSLIAAECLSETTFTRYVWEWPTTAANGYVRSVGLCPNAGLDTQQSLWGGVARTTYWSYFVPPAKYIASQLCWYDATAQMFWWVDNSGVYARPVTVAPYDMMEIVDYIPGDTTTASALKANFGFGAVNCSDVTGDGTNLYIAGSTSSIKKFTIPTSVGADPTESTISVSGRTAMVRLAHDGSYLWVSEGSTVYRVHPTSGAIERSFAVVGAPTGMWWYTERGLLLISYNSELFGYDLDGNLVLRAAGPRGALIENLGYSYSYLTDHMLWTRGALSYNSNYRDCECLGSFRTGTRTVLGAEVEKTNLTGMKLTYTFTFS